MAATDEDKLLKQTKSMLRAVLISAPRGVVARRIQAEYKSITGTPIPYQRLGYCSLEDFLRSIPDVIRASPGATGELTFFGEADDSTAHIAKLVSKQKKPKVTRAHVTPTRPVFPRQNKFFGHRSPMKPGGSGTTHFTSQGPRRPLPQSSPRMVSTGPDPNGLLLSQDGVGRCRQNLSVAELVPIKGLSRRVTLPKSRMLKVKGVISGTPQLRNRWVNNGQQQHYGSVLVRDSLPKGFTILCLFVSPLWDVDRSPDFRTYLLDGDAVVVYAYPEVIKTPRFYEGRSVALQVIALQMSPKSQPPVTSQSHDLRSTLPPKRSFQDDPGDLRHLLPRHPPVEDPADLRHVLSAKQKESAADLRLVINDLRQQKSEVKEVMLSDVTSPTSSTALQTQSSPLKGSDAKLERDIYEIIQQWPAGMLWTRVEKLYRDKFKIDLPPSTVQLVGRMESVKVEELPCGIIAYPATPLPATPLPATPLPATPPALSPSVTPSHSDGPTQKTPLNVGDNVVFVITNVRSPSCFYGYKMDDNEQVHELIKRVHTLYQTTPCPLPEVGGAVPGAVYAAQFSDDQIWYRAMVKSVNENKGIVNVFYLEFGNEEEIPLHRLQLLSADLASLPPLTVQLALSPADVAPDQGTGWSDEATSKFSALVLDKEVNTVITCCIRDTSGYRYEVQAKDLTPSLVEAGIAKPHLPAEALPSPPSQGEDSVGGSHQLPPRIPSVIELPDKFFDCYVTHILSPASFHIQRVGPQYHEQLEALETDMTKHFAQNKAVPAKPLQEDSLVALRSVEEDGSTYWYRAKVLSVLPQESKVEVKMLDYGNTDMVDMKDVMLLPSQFYRLQFQAVHCCLRGLSDFLESPKIFETFMAYQDKPSLTAKVVEGLGTRVTLELMDQENIEKGSINVQLMSLGTPIAQLSPEMPSVGERVSVTVTDISAAGVVSVQIHGPSLPPLDELMKLINAQYSQKSTATSFVQDVTEGLMCCAKCDDEWYRVTVLKVEEKSVHVEYTDSGKTATLERRDLRKKLEDRLFALPAQAVKCRLADLPPPNGEWKAAAVSALWDAVSDCLCEIEVVSSPAGDLPLVRMWCKEEEGEEQDVSALMCAQPEAFGLPPVPQETTSDPEAVSGLSTDPYEDFTFETDTTGEEDEVEGTRSKSDGSQLLESKGESPKADKTAVECCAAVECQASSSSDNPAAAVSESGPVVAQLLPTSAVEGPEVPATSSEPLGNREGLFDVSKLESFKGRLGPPELVKDKFVLVCVSYVNSPTDFWVAPCTRDAEYKRFRSALEAYCNQATPTEAATVKEGTVCAQQKTATGEWARILRVDQTQAFLMDIGGMVPSSGQPCVLLPPVLSEVPPLAVCCSLCGLRPDSAGHWSREAVTKFSELVERQNLCALAVGMQIDGKQKRRHLVELVDTATSDSSDVIISTELLQMRNVATT